MLCPRCALLDDQIHEISLVTTQAFIGPNACSTGRQARGHTTLQNVDNDLQPQMGRAHVSPGQRPGLTAENNDTKPQPGRHYLSCRVKTDTETYSHPGSARLSWLIRPRRAGIHLRLR